MCCVILFTCRFGAEQVGAVLEPLVQTDTCADTDTSLVPRRVCTRVSVGVCVRVMGGGGVCEGG